MMGKRCCKINTNTHPVSLSWSLINGGAEEEEEEIINQVQGRERERERTD